MLPEPEATPPDPMPSPIPLPAGDGTTIQLPDASKPDPNEETLLQDLRVVFSRRTTDDGAVCEPAEALEGRTIGRYRVIRLIGEGGMARVYEAMDPQAGLQVALKILKPQYAANQSLFARFTREAESLARIQHEHVVRILELAGEQDERAIVMELLTGGSVRDRAQAQRQRGGRMAPADAVDLVLQAASGLEAAHNIGVVHRDLKPSNLLISGDGQVKVADFGTILIAEGTTWLTGIGQRIGTPAYMSPEQCEGKRVTAASDIYALGVTLFELVTGRLPFEVEEASPFAIMLKHISEPPPDPRSLRPEVSDELADAILRCLAKQPALRFQSAGELVQVLSKVRTTRGETEDDASAREPGWRVDVAAVRKQLEHLPQRAIVCWACRCARRVLDLNSDPRLVRALEMAESTLAEPTESSSDVLAQALSRIRGLRAASLKAAYAYDAGRSSDAEVEAARAVAAAAASGAALCAADTAADAAFAARCAIAALQLAGKSIKPFWEAARRDYRVLVDARLGHEGTVGQPVPRTLFDRTP